jgi:hypothetical protein
MALGSQALWSRKNILLIVGTMLLVFSDKLLIVGIVGGVGLLLLATFIRHKKISLNHELKNLLLVSVAAVGLTFLLEFLAEATSLIHFSYEYPGPMHLVSLERMAYQLWNSISGVFLLFGADIFSLGWSPGPLGWLAYIFTLALLLGSMVAFAKITWRYLKKPRKVLSKTKVFNTLISDESIVVLVGFFGALFVSRVIFGSQGLGDQARFLVFVVAFGLCALAYFCQDLKLKPRKRRYGLISFVAILVLGGSLLVSQQIYKPQWVHLAWANQEYRDLTYILKYESIDVLLSDYGESHVAKYYYESNFDDRLTINIVYGCNTPSEFIARKSWYLPEENQRTAVFRLNCSYEDIKKTYGEPVAVYGIRENDKDYPLYIFDYDVRSRHDLSTVFTK